MDFPNTVQEIMPIAGNYNVLRKSPQYQRIINIIKMVEPQGIIEESKKLDKLTWKKGPTKKHKKRLD